MILLIRKLIIKNMNKLNTDLLLFLLAIGLMTFTYLGLTDPKDFVAFIGMVASYKFGRSQGVDIS